MIQLLHIVPEEANSDWRSHAWHGEIAHSRLPEKQLITLGDSLVTRSEFLGPEKALGGVYSATGDYISVSRHLRRSKDLTADNPAVIRLSGDTPRLRGRYLYLGWFFNHYGHFLLESLSRSWPLLQNHQFDGYLFHIHAQNSAPVPRLLAFTDLLGIPRDKLIFITRDLQLEELVLPSQQGILSRKISADILRLYKRIAERAWHKQNSPAGPHKLYISRRLLAASQRYACNEKELEDHFASQGYQVLHSQFLDVETQLAFYYSATHFAGLDGSGLHNILFASAPSNVWMLGASNRIADAITQVNLNELCGCSTELMLQKAKTITALAPQITPFLIDQAVKKHCGLPDHPPSPFSIYSWLTLLGDQLRRKNCLGLLDNVMDELELGDEERRVLLVHTGTTTGQPTIGCAGNALEGLLQVEEKRREGDLHGAAQRMELLLTDNQCNPLFLRRYSEILQADGSIAKALKIAGEALVEDAENPDIKLLRARLQLQAGDNEDAEVSVDEIMKQYPLHIPSWVLQSELAANREDYCAAAVMLREILALVPQLKGLYARLTWYLIQAGDLLEAEQSALRALEIDPGNAFSTTHLARIYVKGRQWENALLWANRAVDQMPGSKELYRLRAQIHHQLGKKAEARNDLGLAVKPPSGK